MTINDYDTVYQLWLSCKGMGLNHLDDSREGIAAFLARNPHTCLVSTEGEKIVGVIMAGHDGRRAYIYHTAVDPSHQGRGIDSRLVEACLLAIKEEGIHKVALLILIKMRLVTAFGESVVLWLGKTWSIATDHCRRLSV